MYKNNEMALKTLNILYRTIIQSKIIEKGKDEFELSAKKLSIL